MGLRFAALLALLALLATLTGAAPAGASLAIADGATHVEPEPARRITILAAGDLLIHTPIFLRADSYRAAGYDFRRFFARIRPLVRSADLAVCHAEVPIGAPGPPSTYPLFNAPAALARAVAWTGFDACTTASNHALDRGREGVAATLRSLRRAGVQHAGTARSRRESRRTTILEAQGLRVALLSYTYGTNGLPLPQPWSVNRISAARIAADARRARRRGADLVLANLHWGAEYAHSPSSEQRSLARLLLRRRIVDAIVGQHAHVVQPIERIRGRFVVYGEGNLISDQDSDSQEGLLAVLHVRAAAGRARVTRVDYMPVWVEPPDYVVQPVPQRLRTLGRRGLARSYLAQALLASYRRTVAYAGRGRFIRPALLPDRYR